MVNAFDPLDMLFISSRENWRFQNDESCSSFD